MEEENRQLDKERLGAFLAARRREKGWTQKELAARLYVSDKAVSKWERGLSAPDVGLLLPLAQALEVSVTELLKGERVAPSPLPPQEVEELLQQALSYRQEAKLRRPKEPLRQLLRLLPFQLLGWGEAALLIWGVKIPWQELGSALPTGLLLSLVFGLLAHCWLREDLPRYYDENPISAVYDGPFNIQLGGARFNNRNWPPVLRALRRWSRIFPLVLPLCSGGLWALLGPEKVLASDMIQLALILGSLFVPLYWAAWKYK